MRTLILHRAGNESVAAFKADIHGLLYDLKSIGARVIRAGIGKNTAHIRVA